MAGPTPEQILRAAKNTVSPQKNLDAERYRIQQQIEMLKRLHGQKGAA